MLTQEKNTFKDEPVRLNKFLSDAGYCSRREADRLIEAGRITVDGQKAAVGMKISPSQIVRVDGEVVERENERVLLSFHKPRGVVCTTDTTWGDTTIYDLIDYPKRVFSAGRLDKDSEGLLLMTNDGDLVNKIMRAANYHEKEYLVSVDREIRPDFLQNLSEGVYLKELNIRTRPCEVFSVDRFRFRIILTQGLNRQIRRMCDAFGYRVTRLIRVRVMNVELGNLKPGAYRPLTTEEAAGLLDQVSRQ
ncbi:MAG: pseudouridine synthase [Lachnospiraceae bacterium]|nr:pseudouridine synthase [Lachnospiraceae bacterium]